MPETNSHGPNSRRTSLTTQSVLPSRPAGAVTVVTGGSASRSSANNAAPKTSAAVSTAPAPRKVAKDQTLQEPVSEMAAILSQLDKTADFMRDLKLKSFQKAPEAAGHRKGNAKRKGSAAGKDVGKSEPTVVADPVVSDAFRASLASHLSTLDSITSEMMSSFSRFKPGEVVLKKLCTRFQVADLVSEQTSNVTFFTDRAEYNFKNEKVGLVRMVMYYRDTEDVTVTRNRRTVSFHVFNPFECFLGHYDHQNPGHRIAIQFTTIPDLMEVERLAVPMLRGKGPT